MKPSWTQPICSDCYTIRYPGMFPYRMREPLVETCVDCGVRTASGIYIRIDPATARYPTNTKED